MKVSLVHPFRHHAYYSALGIANSNKEFKSILGMYNTGSSLFKILEQTNYSNKVKGYKNEKLDEFVLSKDKLSLLFLLSKVNPKIYKMYINQFQRFAIDSIKNDDVVYLLQDYCQDVFDYAYKSGKFIIYDHIMPCGFENRKILLEEAGIWGYSNDYADKYMPEDKIHKNYDNIDKSNIVINASNSTNKVCLDVLKGKNIDKLRIIPYGNKITNTVDVKVKYDDILSRKLKILYVGSISLIKGIGYLLEALDGIDKNEIEVGVVGVPNKEEDIKLLEEIKKRTYIRYYGSIPHIQIGEIYKNYDIFVLPSIIEGFGMVTLEALSYGLPCIVNESCPSVIENGIDGMIVESRNSNMLRDTILSLIDNKVKVAQMSQNAIVKSRLYTWEKYQSEITEIIDSINL